MPRTVFHCRDSCSTRSVRNASSTTQARGSRRSPSRAAFEKVAYRGTDGSGRPAGTSGPLDALDVPADAFVLVAEGIEKSGNPVDVAFGRVRRGARGHRRRPGDRLGNPNVIRGSKGAVYAVPVATTTWAGSARGIARGIRLVATTLDASALHTATDLTEGRDQSGPRSTADRIHSRYADERVMYSDGRRDQPCSMLVADRNNNINNNKCSSASGAQDLQISAASSVRCRSAQRSRLAQTDHHARKPIAHAMAVIRSLVPVSECIGVHGRLGTTRAWHRNGNVLRRHAVPSPVFGSARAPALRRVAARPKQQQPALPSAQFIHAALEAFARRKRPKRPDSEPVEAPGIKGMRRSATPLPWMNNPSRRHAPRHARPLEIVGDLRAASGEWISSRYEGQPRLFAELRCAAWATLGDLRPSVQYPRRTASPFDAASAPRKTPRYEISSA